MFPGVQGSSSGSNTQTGAENNAKASKDPTLTTKDMFLKLLVAQIKNQDPLSPADGAQFLTQLAQFTQLEQTITQTGDIQAIRKDLDKIVPPDASGSSDSQQ